MWGCGSTPMATVHPTRQFHGVVSNDALGARRTVPAAKAERPLYPQLGYLCGTWRNEEDAPLAAVSAAVANAVLAGLAVVPCA